ncbi:MAG: hypothetical protein IKZ09_00230 [Clostridia bacterium]|nr:hypothetical protein [Clostridia bacterium]
MKAVRMVLLALTILFAVLCFIGAGYVLANGGEVNAGYAVVPMAACIACSVLLQRISRKKINLHHHE